MDRCRHARVPDHMLLDPGLPWRPVGRLPPIHLGMDRKPALVGSRKRNPIHIVRWQKHIQTLSAGRKACVRTATPPGPPGYRGPHRCDRSPRGLPDGLPMLAATPPPVPWLRWRDAYTHRRAGAHPPSVAQPKASVGFGDATRFWSPIPPPRWGDLLQRSIPCCSWLAAHTAGQSSNAARMCRRAVSGSAASVTGRPMTKKSAPAAKAAPGVACLA